MMSQRKGPTIQQQRVGRTTGGAAAFFVLLSFLGLSSLLTSVPDSPDVVFILAASLILAVCIIRWPVTGIYLAVVMTILFDALPSPYAPTFFSESGIFRNLSYRGLPDGVVVSLFELVIVVSLISALVRRFHERKKLVRGPLFWPMMFFAAVLVVGEVSGLLTGGDFKISLWELRPLIYLVLLYMLAVNTVNQASQIRVLLWLMVICVGIRSVEGIWRYLQIPLDIRADVPTVLEHDDSLFLVIPFSLLLALTLWRKWLPMRMLPAVVLLIPTVFYVIIINRRRAAFLCIFLIIATLLPLIWVSLKSKRQRVRFVYIAIAGGILGSLYLAAFWNGSGGLAEPARSVRSMIQPDERDFSSNLYRDQENANLRYTISLSPFTGIGFGKPMQINSPILDLRETWALQFYMPHNNMLWLWMRMGIIGFALFWMVIGAAVLLVAACMRLGIARMWTLLTEEREQILALPPGVATPPTNFYTPGMLTQFRPALGARGQEIGMERGALAKGLDALRFKRRELHECADFLTFTLLVLGILVSLVAAGIVDQGLMGFRLTAFSGAMLGALAGVWNMYQSRLPVVAHVADEQSQNEPRRGVRRISVIAGAT